ncbi:uncharacterized protein LOC131151013 [Malania oleifera]|uniref:uncharacterized protein LOC131151013 n=1 Tax=Malania oleifera TaxID=397392 RepID=UPI0025ADE6EC|nr:uncharacterized protein LOC131151013 [Malania oleifera]
MKVYPVAGGLALRYDVAARLSGGIRKELRRLPHVFTSVLQLPLRSDADVAVEESPDCFRFVAESDEFREVRARIIEIHPGLVKVVVGEARGVESRAEELDLELDVWRLRLPATARPQLASAACAGGELVVTVPKYGQPGREIGRLDCGDGDEGGFWGGGKGDMMGEVGRPVLVLVQ